VANSFSIRLIGCFIKQETFFSSFVLPLGSSVSIVSDYRLDDWATGVRSPADANGISSNLFVQTTSEAHPASNQWVPGVVRVVNQRD
jgi:hypothetical protein